MRRITASLTLLAAITAFAACSGPDKTESSTVTTEQPVERTAPPETTEHDQEEHTAGDEADEHDDHEHTDPGEGIAWTEKTPKQKAAYMKMTVMPAMEETFQEFDAEAFAEFKCSTCHGKDAKERHFEMPSPSLPKLDFAKMQAEHPQSMEFMKNKVVPQMAALLGQEPYNPETKEGFGCAGCHMQ